MDHLPSMNEAWDSIPSNDLDTKAGEDSASRLVLDLLSGKKKKKRGRKNPTQTSPTAAQKGQDSLEDTREPGKGPRPGSLARSSSLNTDEPSPSEFSVGHCPPSPPISFLALKGLLCARSPAHHGPSPHGQKWAVCMHGASPHPGALRSRC